MDDQLTQAARIPDGMISEEAMEYERHVPREVTAMMCGLDTYTPASPGHRRIRRRIVLSCIACHLKMFPFIDYREQEVRVSGELVEKIGSALKSGPDKTGDRFLDALLTCLIELSLPDVGVLQEDDKGLVYPLAPCLLADWEGPEVTWTDVAEEWAEYYDRRDNVSNSQLPTPNSQKGGTMRWYP